MKKYEVHFDLLYGDCLWKKKKHLITKDIYFNFVSFLLVDDITAEIKQTNKKNYIRLTCNMSVYDNFMQFINSFKK